MTDGTALDAALAQIDQAFGTSLRTGLPATMTERVARELCGLSSGCRDLRGPDRTAYIDAGWREFVEDARWVFSAMYSPTDEMLNDVEGSQDKDDYQDLLTAREQIEHIWQVMLTTAEYEMDPESLAQRARQAEADQKWREAGSPDDPTAPF